MKAFKLWKDFESESINEKDLLQFALDLWRNGSIKVEAALVDDKKIVRYSIKCLEDEEE